jgi:hypothetical protein
MVMTKEKLAEQLKRLSIVFDKRMSGDAVDVLYADLSYIPDVDLKKIVDRLLVEDNYPKNLMRYIKNAYRPPIEYKPEGRLTEREVWGKLPPDFYKAMKHILTTSDPFERWHTAVATARGCGMSDKEIIDYHMDPARLYGRAQLKMLVDMGLITIEPNTLNQKEKI